MQNTNQLPIGFNARLFPGLWRPARDEIAFAAAHGFEAIQFPGEEYGLGETRLGAPVEAIAELLQQTNLTAVMEIVIWIDATVRTPHGFTPVEVLQANLPAITALRCAAVHWHLVPSRRMDAAELLKLERAVIPYLAEGVALAETAGFRFGFEHNAADLPLLSQAERCAELLEAVPGLGFVWDLNHTPPDALSDFLAFTPRMTMLHVSDTVLPDVNYHWPLGMGSIDFAAYYRELVARGFCGPSILEIGGQRKSGGFGRDTDTALADSRLHLSEVIGVGG